VLLLIEPTTAQPVAPGRGPGGAQAGRGAAGAGFNAKHAQDQLAALKGYLELGEDEWKVLSPKIEKVFLAKQKTNTGAGMNWTSSNNAKPAFQPSNAKPDTAAGKAMRDVRDAVADQAASDQELVKRMAAVREARQKARAEYEAAQKDLIAAISPRQQAVLMTLGVVE
jgi:hypothetical protein